MSFLALTVDVESDSAAFADPKCSTYRGVSEGLLKLLDFFSEHGYPATLFVACDVLSKLDANLILKSSMEVASHGCGHTFPPLYLMALSSDELEREVVMSKTLLNETFKAKVTGFRSHGLTISSEILELLSKHYIYDSSVLLHRKYDGREFSKGQYYHPARESVVEIGDSSIIELPVSSTKLGFLKVPFIGSYIRLLPKSVFTRAQDPLIVIDLHSQDVVKFKGWKYLFVSKYLLKLRQIVDHYENKGYQLCLMKQIVEHAHL
jgi:hypothetical protein